jgi:succinate-semialdehyde dehydrogenase/glutarate-semialdehyde dehydrogenase
MANTFSTINPFTEGVIETFAFQTESEVDAVLHRASAAFTTWRHTPFAIRHRYIQAVREKLLAQKDALAKLITTEMGKPLRESLAEVDKCALLCDYYLTHAENFLVAREESFADKHVRHTLSPTGVVFGIMPWNYPLWQVFRYAIPNLMAGNGVLLKHAPNTTGCSLALQSLFDISSYPAGIFQSLVIDIDLVERVIAHPAVQGVCLTGSVGAGRSVGALAGKYLKKVVLELGSADAFVILDDAPIDRALDANFTSRTQNAGQACIAAKRTFVPRHKVDYAISYLQEKLVKIQLGDPFKDSTHVGPISKKSFVGVLQNQVDQAIRFGGKRIIGAEAQGVFFKPGLITTRSDNAINDEEIFGPVINIIAYDDEQQLVQEVNGTAFGLAASVWSVDEEHALRVAQQLEAGTVVINDFMKSDPRIPFGGIKNSGFGREMGEAGLRSFLNEKPIITVKK